MPKIKSYYLILDVPFNRVHYGALISKVLPRAPLFARYRIV